MAYEYNSSILGYLRQGNAFDGFVNITNDTKKIIDGKCKLDEIPLESDHVYVTSVASPFQNEIYTEIFTYEIGINNFRVDYTSGIVYFNSNANGKILTFKYTGRGATYINAERVFTKEEGGNITETLSDIVQDMDNIKTAYDNATKANLSVEVSNARGTFGTLKARLDTSEAEFAAYKSENASKFTEIDEHLAESVSQGVHGMGTIATQDYEEGTWTPDLYFSGENVGMSYEKQMGKYIKVGKSITCFIDIILTSKGTSVGIAHISGFPFSTPNTPVVHLGNLEYVNQQTGGIDYIGIIGTNVMYLRSNRPGSNAIAITNVEFANNSRIRVSFVYNIG